MSKFYEEIFKCKLINRKGWVERNAFKSVGRCESDAEHMFSAALLALEIINKEKLPLNQEKVLKMLLLHDVCEIDAGDVTPNEHVDPKIKHNNEDKCMQRIATECDLSFVYEIWKEFEEGVTPEAKFARKIDKLDAVVQAKVYSKTLNDTAVFEEFRDYAITISDEFKKYI